ncbi:MAG: hypothetical protein NT144_01685, partial [Bacteroidia bacterium]|nr:hypothetical protein [Bacteroidia bacterium]
MIGRSYSNIIKTFLSLLILSGLTVSLFSQDKQISGVVNVYRRVDAIGPGLDNVTLNNVDSISPGDTVLLIQMQGVEIVTDQNAYGGGVQDTIGKPGGYEFLLVQLVNSVTNKVVFRNNLLNTYDIKGSVQLVRVPYYNSATVTGMLTAKSWDNIEKTGGVLTMILGRKLKLNAEIDVSGKGFLGGKDTIGIGECVMTNPTDNNHDSYPRTWLNAGYKGEGLAIHDQFGTLLAPLHMKGQGINFTGGGGGNGKYSGGGGGSNRGKGGDGTFEKNLGVGSCPNFQPGAYGGTTVKATVILNGIFFGGGGGASTHAVGSTGSSGGNGGGIVIIIADTISGNSKSIKADGATAGNAISDAGAGGGGAGGSVVLSLQSFSNVSTDSLKISVKGGNGGTNAGGFGTGGGGGGGLLWVSTAAIPGKVPVKYNYGIPGPSSEGNGEIKYTFSPKLNGFLFNSIRSAVTGNQVDSICSNVTFGQITGTKPLGGVAPHSYLWQSSTTSEFFGYATASGISDGQNYFPGILTQSTWFRRVVKDSGGTILTDTSKAVRIIVQPFIKNNIVGNPDTICFSGDPQLIQQLVPALIVPTTKHLIFNWQDSTSSNIWGSPVALSENYDPPSGLGKTTWYRRTVTSGRCVDSTAIVKITVLPSITNDSILSLPQDICFGSTFTDLIATTAATTPAMAGGDNLYRFKWESNINGLGWGTAPGVSNGAGYNPAELPSKSPMNEYYFRRVVSSGIHDVCVDTSKSVLLKDFPVITNNTITANRTICSGSTPAKLIGSTPLNGNGIYTFTWQDSSKAHTWTIITGASLSDYQPAGLTDTTSYRRIVNSSACIDISKSITIIVHKPILNNNITLLAGGLIDTTICNGQVPHLLKSTVATGGTNIPGSYFYQWKFSTDNITFSPVPAGGTLVNFTPPALTTTTYYKREVTSGACTVISSSTIKVTVLPLITNNIISTNQTVCYNTQP